MFRALRDLSRNGARRLNGLVNIGIDETSYRKGHKYITIVVNHDTNTVVWVADGHGKLVLEQFYKSLTDASAASTRCLMALSHCYLTASMSLLLIVNAV